MTYNFHTIKAVREEAAKLFWHARKPEHCAGVRRYLMGEFHRWHRSVRGLEQHAEVAL